MDSTHVIMLHSVRACTCHPYNPKIMGVKICMAKDARAGVHCDEDMFIR